MADDQTPKKGAKRSLRPSLMGGALRAILEQLEQRRSEFSESEKGMLHKVFPLIVGAVHRKLWNRLIGRGLNEDAAKDVMQNTLISIFDGICVKGYPEDLNEYAYRLAKKAFWDYLADRKRNKEWAELPSSGSERPRSSGTPDLDRVLDAAAFHAEALPQLSLELREVAEAVFVNQLSHSQACELLDIPLGTLKGRITQAKQALYEIAVRIIPSSQRRPR